MARISPCSMFVHSALAINLLGGFLTNIWYKYGHDGNPFGNPANRSVSLNEIERKKCHVK